jgi:citrate lyase subunit beta / citryl-CoA lyase
MRSSPKARSYLYCPADNHRLLGKVFSVGADAAVIDLEDSVLEARKAEARIMAVAAIREKRAEMTPLYIRINAVKSAHWRSDLEAVVGPQIAGIRIPKASADAVAQVDEALRPLERTAGLPAGSVRIVPVVESAVGLFDARDMARCDRVEAFCFGAVDFLRDIAGEDDGQGAALAYAESHLVVVSRASEVAQPISPVHTAISDLTGLRTSSIRLRQMGFFGRSCIHPSQLPVVHEIFTPTEADLARARAILECAARAAASGNGATATTDGELVDEAVVSRARQLIELSESVTRGPR